jgi:hypothetical protein
MLSSSSLFPGLGDGSPRPLTFPLPHTSLTYLPTYVDSNHQTIIRVITLVIAPRHIASTRHDRHDRHDRHRHPTPRAGVIVRHVRLCHAAHRRLDISPASPCSSPTSTSSCPERVQTGHRVPPAIYIVTLYPSAAQSCSWSCSTRPPDLHGLRLRLLSLIRSGLVFSHARTICTFPPQFYDTRSTESRLANPPPHLHKATVPFLRPPFRPPSRRCLSLLVTNSPSFPFTYSAFTSGELLRPS